MKRALVLTCYRDGAPVLRCRLAEGSRTIGRRSACDVQLESAAVSRQHAQLVVEDGLATLIDLQSRNGTCVDGRELLAGERASLPPGVPAKIGPFCFVIHQAPDRGREALETVRALFADRGIKIRYQLGEGAAGSVWAGWHEALDRMVAVKLLEGVADEEIARFLREGQVCGRLRHRHVVRVHDMLLAGGTTPALILEFVAGVSAHVRVSQGPLPLGDAVRICAGVAHALVALSEAGVVHRDVKPSNVLLGMSGEVKLTDFGIARDLASRAGLTEAGSGLGTLAYLPPEQLTEARWASPAADVYGLGATIYHLVSGKVPFAPRLGESILQQIAHQSATPLTTLRADCPSELQDLVARMMLRDPAARPTAGDVLRDLAPLLADLQPLERSANEMGDTTHD